MDCWGPPWWFGALKLVPVLDFWRKLVILGHVGKGPNLTLELISVHPTIQGGPNNGLEELEPNRSHLNHFPTGYAQYSNFCLFSCRFCLINNLITWWVCMTTFSASFLLSTIAPIRPTSTWRKNYWSRIMKLVIIHKATSGADGWDWNYLHIKWW